MDPYTAASASVLGVVIAVLQAFCWWPKTRYPRFDLWRDLRLVDEQNRLVVEKEFAAQQILGTFFDTPPWTTNPFRGRLEVVYRVQPKAARHVCWTRREADGIDRWLPAESCLLERPHSIVLVFKPRGLSPSVQADEVSSQNQ
jgi:hypothetical protein